jgi:riboflavin synthase
LFAGIVAVKGRVGSLPEGLSGRLMVSHPDGWGGLATGDSLAVSGCCLTVIEPRPDRVTVEVMPETLRRTTLKTLHVEDEVNLETALRLQDAVGGHLVTGHVDATGTVVEISREENAVWLTIEVPPAVARYCVAQGSIAVDGCSLTIVSVEDGKQETALLKISLIPHTVKATIASNYRTGSVVNLESDLVAKLVERLAAPHLREPQTSSPLHREG